MVVEELELEIKEELSIIRIQQNAQDRRKKNKMLWRYLHKHVCPFDAVKLKKIQQI